MEGGAPAPSNDIHDDLSDLADLISLQIAQQPRANVDNAVQIGLGGSQCTRKENNDDDDDTDDISGFVEGRNKNETTNDNKNRFSKAVGVDHDKHWSKWSSGELLQFLRKEMLSCDLNEEKCNVFLSQLSEQGINGSMIKLLKSNQQFQIELKEKMDKHPFAIWMVFQSTINNLK